MSIFLVVALISFAPVTALQKATQAADLNKLLIGGAIGAAGLVAAGALIGPIGAIGAVGAAGTGIVGAIGGTLGTVVSGVTAIASSMGELSMSAVSTLGLMLGGAAIGVAGLLGTGFALVPLAVLGAGVTAYMMKRSNYRYGTPYDRRYSGPLHDSFFDAGSRFGNRSGDRSLSDRVRSIFDRDRRDDNFYSSNRHVDQNGYIRQGSDTMSSINRFFNGTNGGYNSGDPLRRDSNFMNNRTYDSGAIFPTDRSGRVVGSQNDFRTGFRGPMTAEDSAKPSVTNNEVVVEKQITLEEAESARKQAYENLIKAMQNSENSDGDVPATLNSKLLSEEVKSAVSEYKEADKLLKELTGRLQHMEKQ